MAKTSEPKPVSSERERAGPGKGDDRPVAKGEDLTVLNVTRQYWQEARRARWTRTLKNRTNLRMFIGEQDYSYKARGQSKEFIPKLPMAVEQFSGAVKRALTDYGDWFRSEVDNAPLTGEQVRSIIQSYFARLTDGYIHTSFPVVGSRNSLPVAASANNFPPS